MLAIDKAGNDFTDITAKRGARLHEVRGETIWLYYACAVIAKQAARWSGEIHVEMANAEQRDHPGFGEAPSEDIGVRWHSTGAPLSREMVSFFTNEWLFAAASLLLVAISGCWWRRPCGTLWLLVAISGY